MNVKIKNKTAVIEFENNTDTAGHADVMREIIKLIDYGFKKFIFDFKWVGVSFNSGISGFLITVTKKMIDVGAEVAFDNISEQDMELLRVVGLDDLKIKRVEKDK